MTSLDDLLERGEGSGGRAVQPLVRQHLAWAVKATLAAAALAAAVTVVLLVLEVRLWYPVVAAAILAGLVLHRLVARLGVRTPVREVGDLEREPGEGNPDGLGPAVHRWRTRLRRGDRTLHPHLAELVDERLRQRHGCTRGSDPDRARALLGERLWSYLADPAARTPASRELAAMLTTVEEL
jgi:hypothetical protein